MSSRATLSGLAAACIVSFACGEELDPIVCNQVGCADRLVVRFSYRAPGEYAVAVTVDGVTHTCRAVLPPAPGPPPIDECDLASGVILDRGGTGEPADTRDLGGVEILSSTAGSVTIRVSRDGELLDEASFVPDYVVTPSPNGPGCEPNECRYASYELQSR